jgi:hypothetical protein
MIVVPRPAVAMLPTVVLLALSACAQPAPAGTAGPGSTVSPTMTSPAAYPPPAPANVAPFDLSRIRLLPADAKVGTVYPFDLYAHCGIDLVRFGDANWRAEPPYGDGLPGYIAGTMELLDPNTARFVVDLRYFASRTEVIIYHRTNEEVPTCL